ncbi:hypothetical protein PFLUV_G00128420 [Perca fluviatilis]|uniref:Uncharacterized protein n=1 Tax=Perca fluviatilis TaxID=8168 RepID=A0A6A5EQ89_PERFL|nr:hypothetical protein PFLUV_G00128420 [Perca fluviatilis]
MPIHLTVTPTGPPLDPNLFILSPLQPDGWNRTSQDSLGPEVCLATDFRPKENETIGDMVLNQKDGPVIINTTSSAPLSKKKNRNYVFAGFTNRSIYSCEMQGMGENNDNRELCADFHPEKAKLNFYLLVMNGVRVVFTKTLAFNTILTIRAVLF